MVSCAIKFGGGHKGHNGLRSIMGVTGSADFHRIRVGVSRPANRDDGIADYLLSVQPAAQRMTADQLLAGMARADQQTAGELDRQFFRNLPDLFAESAKEPVKVLLSAVFFRVDYLIKRHRGLFAFGFGRFYHFERFYGFA
jgi:hypothetical protein